MKRRLVVVALPWTRNEDTELPLGHASLLACLNRIDELSIRSVVQAINHGAYTVDALTRIIHAEIHGLPPQSVDVAVGVYVWNDKHVIELVRRLRCDGFEGRIILGGPQITYAGPRLEKMYPGATAFIRGNAESALCALALNDGRPCIQGVHYAGDTDTGEQAAIDSETLASPWGKAHFSGEDKALVRWETQRGCNFRCSFCQHRRPNAGTAVTRINPQRIRDEIDRFCRAKVKRIAVLDPVFNRYRTHAVAVLRQFQQHHFQGELSLQCRAEMIDDEFLDAAQGLNVCMEFGLQSIHSRECRAVGRQNDMRKVNEALEKVQRRKIRHEISLIYGLPEQTLESFQKTVQWCLDRKIPVVKAFPLLLLRGTVLEQERRKWSMLIEDSELPRVIESGTFSFEDWKSMDRIAGALSSTEGHHPSTLNDLHQTFHSNACRPADSQRRALGK